MKSFKFIYLAFIIAGLYSCNNTKKETEINKIKNMESKLYSDSTKSIMTSATNDLILEYAKFSNTFPDDSLSPEYLFRAGELSRAVNMSRQAILYYDKITYTYPKYRKVAVCFFLEGFVYENQMNDLINAKKFYKLFITKYPTHPLVKDAKILIENLGKSPEELIQNFEEKEKQNKKPI
jgi:outer membrane protein assembly factor BamD (BamD/ComL family)